jgi:hypothetical protein
MLKTNWIYDKQIWLEDQYFVAFLDKIIVYMKGKGLRFQGFRCVRHEDANDFYVFNLTATELDSYYIE